MPSRNDIDPATIRNLYWNEGLSLDGVAARLGGGITTSGVHMLMERYNIPRRGRTEAYKAYLDRVVAEAQADPDQGLELRPEVEATLRRSLETPRESLLTTDEMRSKLDL